MIEPIERIYTIQNTMRPTLIEAHISDIHFGAMCPKYQYNTLTKQFTQRLWLMPKLDIVSINGDLFHHKLLANSDAVMYADLFISDLINLCRAKGATLVLIHGTEHHDANQLKIFYKYLHDASVDIRIVEQIRFEYIKGAKILCIPEIYGLADEDYLKYLVYGGYYDSVFMHGEILGSIYKGEKPYPRLGSDKAPIFNDEHFRMCTGPVISGHVHTRVNLFEDMYYCGSPYRWQFGEEEEKGFYIVVHNLETQGYAIYPEVINCLRYDTVKLLSGFVVDDVVLYVNDLLKEIDFLRLDVDDNMSEEDLGKLEVLKKYFKKNKNLKFKIPRKDKILAERKNEEMRKEYSQYDYLFNSEINEFDKLAMYINQQKNTQFITGQDIMDIFNDPF